ncbi:uncharacterized protein BCN122_I0776 [Burkholderia cenocepacia]|nr:uncharacterized protein BCN122_I0776 [Burkholderia cenocepacia]
MLPGRTCTAGRSERAAPGGSRPSGDVVEARIGPASAAVGPRLT